MDLTSRSIAATSVVLAALAGHAHAQSAEAEKLFGDGNQLMAAGKIAEACDAFAASNRIEPRAGTLIQLGDCRARNHQLASAWSAYKDALVRVKDPRKRSYATAKVAELEPQLSYLTISVAEASRIDGLAITRDGKPFDAALWNRALPLDGADDAIVARAPGRAEWKTTARVPADHGKIVIQVPRLGEPARPPVATRPPPPAPVVTRPPPPEPTPAPVVVTPPPVAPMPGPDPALQRPQGTFTPTRKLAVGLAGASLVSLGVGIWLGTTANHKKDDAFDLCPEPDSPCNEADEANDTLASSHTYATAANLTFGLALASGAAAGILWFTGGPRRETAHGVSVAPQISPSSVGVVGSVRW